MFWIYHHQLDSDILDSNFCKGDYISDYILYTDLSNAIVYWECWLNETSKFGSGISDSVYLLLF